MYEVIKLQIKSRGQYALLHTPFQGTFINPKPVTIHKLPNYHGSTMIFPDIHPPPRLHLEILQVSQLHLLPWLGSVSTTCYLTTTTISLRDHSSYSHTLPRPPTGLSVEHLRWDSSWWTSCLSHGASSPHTYLSEASFSTLLNVQLKTKESLSPTPHVLSTLVST